MFLFKLYKAVLIAGLLFSSCTLKYPANSMEETW